MKSVGIIVEYNPLHNGHLHHINEVKRQSGCDVLVCVMSGYFTQRGEPAMTDKFARTRMALEAGVDLVVELPFVFSVQSADIFARTSVHILDLIGVDEIYFGSETNNIDELKHIGSILESDEYNDTVKEFSKQGYSYPTASDLAMKQFLPESSFNQPNNILGIQYILAGKHLESTIQFHTIQRVSTQYFDEIKENTTIQSATAIRKALLNNEDIIPYVPAHVSRILATRKTVTYEDFYHALHAIINRSTTQDLQTICGVTEGLENRIKNIHQFSSVADLIDQIISRRYTNSKIKRMLAHILCNVHTTDIKSFVPPYLRVLGMTNNGRQYLNSIKKSIDIPLYTKIKEGLHPYMDVELRVARLYSIASDMDVYKEEFKPVIF